MEVRRRTVTPRAKNGTKNNATTPLSLLLLCGVAASAGLREGSRPRLLLACATHYQLLRPQPRPCPLCSSPDHPPPPSLVRANQKGERQQTWGNTPATPRTTIPYSTTAPASPATRISTTQPWHVDSTWSLAPHLQQRAEEEQHQGHEAEGDDVVNYRPGAERVDDGR